MIRQEEWMDVKVMHRQGASIRKIAQVTGFSRVTVRRILRGVVPKGYGPRMAKSGKLDAHVGRLEELLNARPHARATALFELLAREGYVGSYQLVKRWVGTRRREEMARRRACVRFETAPGLEGQFDWKGPARGLLEREPDADVHFFRFVLAWSRARWTLAVRSLALPSTLAALRWAFERMGAVPRRLVLDNPKTAVLVPKPRLELHPAFLDFCRHYGCEPDPAWPYHPERKGKIERSYQDVVNAGVLERTYPSLAALQAELSAIDEAAMCRVHGTTGELPAERFRREREELLPLSTVRFDPRIPEPRRVLTDCTVRFRTASYSVPFRHVGSRVIVKADPFGDLIEIFAGVGLIARHRIAAKGGRVIVEEHIAELRRPRFERLRERAAAKRRAKAPMIPTLVPLPGVSVEQRPMEDYLAAIGGVR